jgi:hypothetical protein
MGSREAISNLFITVVALFFMVLLGMLLKARYRLPSERTAVAKMSASSDADVPRAIPIASAQLAPKEAVKVHGGFVSLPAPALVVSRGNEPDALRIKSGDREEVYVLYFVEAIESTWTHPRRINAQSSYFGHASTQSVLSVGKQALGFVNDLLQNNPFKVFTKHGRVPESERFYAMISVELQGKATDLGELLVRKGYATHTGQKSATLPIANKTVDGYLKDLQHSETQARSDHAGLWAHAP